MAAVGLVAIFWQSVETLSARREALEAIAERQCPQGDNKPCQSVHADIRAANAAEDMVDLAAWQFLAGVIGIVFVGLTLKATRDAVAEANEATEAARQAVRVTKATGEAQVRAYLSISDVFIGPHDRSEWLFLELTVDNLGNSPASDLSLTSFIQLQTMRGGIDGEPLDSHVWENTPPYPPALRSSPAAKLAPRGKLQHDVLTDFRLTEEMLHLMAEADMIIARVTVICLFRDVFGNEIREMESYWGTATELKRTPLRPHGGVPLHSLIMPDYIKGMGL